MDMQERIKHAEQNIRQALYDYGAHVDDSEVLEDVSDEFIERMARDSSYAKQGLRDLFSKSPVWNDELDALVINGTRTHDPDYMRIWALANQILSAPLNDADNEMYCKIKRAIRFFSNPGSETMQKDGIIAINELAPKAYAPGKKLSRVFKALCVALGVADEKAGSKFQQLYAQFADELNAKKIGYKLFVSINPAHFLTMSNPKHDCRGNCLTSCHSLNSTEYSFNNGCSGYARDNVTFIAFTVDDPSNPELLNNRKTTRQIFAYEPRNGVLLQSRMYNTAGGVYGAVEDSTVYRDIIQREISALEDVPNLWRTGDSTSPEYSDCVEIGFGFGGYPDWTYSNFDGHVSIRADHYYDWHRITVGTHGLCIRCGCKISNGLYCEDCCHGENYCESCQEYTNDELTTVHASNGTLAEVCPECLDEYFTQCDICGEYYSNDCVTRIGNECVCDECRDSSFEQCDSCGEWAERDDMYLVNDAFGDRVFVCEDCVGDYHLCEDCAERFIELVAVYLSDGTAKTVCKDCEDKYEKCPECGQRIEIRDDGTCPHCGAQIIKEADAV